MKQGMIFVVFYDCVSDSPPGWRGRNNDDDNETLRTVMFF